MLKYKIAFTDKMWIAYQLLVAKSIPMFEGLMAQIRTHGVVVNSYV